MWRTERNQSDGRSAASRTPEANHSIAKAVRPHPKARLPPSTSWVGWEKVSGVANYRLPRSCCSKLQRSPVISTGPEISGKSLYIPQSAQRLPKCRSHLKTRLARVALYARVSTLNGRDPEMQLSELREYASRRGWTITSEYVDQGVSGSKESRPELNQLMTCLSALSAGSCQTLRRCPMAIDPSPKST